MTIFKSAAMSMRAGRQYQYDSQRRKHYQPR